MTNVPSVEALYERLAANGIDPAQLVPDATGTLCAALDTREAEVDALPVLTGTAHDELKLKERIGKGGMGIVQLAEQTALVRDVAVKRAVRSAKDRHEAASALVAEARVTGLLQHPHVVPVHALGRTVDGDVLLVMKRIEGTAWSELLAQRPSCTTDLDRHLAILGDVCHAVHFAHSRGVLHRDLKPHNVMIGAFGEVYVLDWGLAVTTHTAVPGVVAAHALTGIAGTPQYMAPEMTVPGEPVAPHTDVYLLGGILHCILTGRPPHQGASMKELLRAAFTAAPPVFDAHADVDDELAAICAKALARDPAQRFASAEELRVALAETTKHAAARTIARAAEEKLALLRSLAHDAPAVEVARLFSACRFGFEQALLAWPASPDATAGLEAALAHMADREIAHGHADAARALMAAMRAPPPALSERVRALDDTQARERAEHKRLDELARAFDPSGGGHLRSLAYAGAVTVWGVFAIGVGALNRSGTFNVGHLELCAMNLVTALVFFVAWIAGRRGAGTRVTTSYMAAAVSALTAVSVMWLVLYRAATPTWVGLVLAHLIVAVSMFSVSRAYEHGFALGAVPLLVGAGAIAARPAWGLEISLFSIAACVVVLVARWARASRAAAAPTQ